MGLGGYRLKMDCGSHFPGQITKATSPSGVGFGQLSSTDNPQISVKRAGAGEGFQ